MANLHEDFACGFETHAGIWGERFEGGLGETQFLQGGGVGKENVSGTGYGIFDVISQGVGKANAGGEADFFFCGGGFVVVV